MQEEKFVPQIEREEFEHRHVGYSKDARGKCLYPRQITRNRNTVIGDRQVNNDSLIKCVWVKVKMLGKFFLYPSQRKRDLNSHIRENQIWLVNNEDDSENVNV